MGEERDKIISKVSSNSDTLEDYTTKILMCVDGLHEHLNKLLKPLNV